jgi:hypothetical protein
MAMQGADYHRAIFNATKALGAKLNAAEATIQFVGFEQVALLCKQFPHPILQGGTEIEVAMPVGMHWEQSGQRTHQQGPIAFYETEGGTVRAFLAQLFTQGGKADAIVYEGTPERFTRRYRITDCQLSIDVPDRDWENKQQVLLVSGSMFFHYFGEEV